MLGAYRWSRSFCMLIALSPLACGSVKTSNLPGGAYHIRCEKGMKDCIARAEKLCEGVYTVLTGRSNLQILGGSTSSYRMATSSAELEVICGHETPEEEEKCITLPPRSDEPSDDPMRPAPERFCVPGSTQQCVGGGACQGGQTCRPDGSGFGPCDCGEPVKKGRSSAKQPAEGEDDEAEEDPAPEEDSSPSKKPVQEESPVEPAPEERTPPGHPRVPGAAPEPVPLR